MAAHLLCKVLVVVCILLVTCNVVAKTGKKSNLSLLKIELQNRLKRFNKSPIKSIKSPDGDIIGCIHIAHQPAFDHPALKNHTIQLRPNYPPKGDFGANKVNAKGSKPINQLWHLNGQCPKGTIPVRRTKIDDLLRVRSLKKFGRKKHRTSPQLNFTNLQDQANNENHQYAVAYIKGDEYNGAKATINVWNPKVRNPNEFSVSQIWISRGSGENVNTIEAGWQVLPSLYGDHNTRFFIYWTRDSYKSTGCYNLLCSGFIQLDRTIALGATIYPISTYDGSQYEITIFIWKDQVEGHWWLLYGTEYALGYWPASIFTELVHSASMIEWGGEVVNLNEKNQHTTTQMGSGHFPEEGFGKASFFRHITYLDESNLHRVPKQLTIGNDHPSCYGIKNFKLHNGEKYFFYGGPGRNSNCS